MKLYMSYYSDDEVPKQQSLIKYFTQGFTFVEKKGKNKRIFFWKIFSQFIINFSLFFDY